MTRVVIRVACREHPDKVLLRLVQPTAVEVDPRTGELFIAETEPARQDEIRGTAWFNPHRNRMQAKFRRRCPVVERGQRCRITAEYDIDRACAVLNHITMAGETPDTFRVGLSADWTVTNDVMARLVMRPESAPAYFALLDARRGVLDDEGSGH